MEAEEEECVAINVNQSSAVPFFEHPKVNKILIKGGKVVNDDGVKPADVMVENGVIVAIDENLDPDADTKVINADGKYVLPGGIDPSTNFYEYSSDEEAKGSHDFSSGSKAALMGGTTTILENVKVNVNKDESLIQIFNEWKESAEEKAMCNIAFNIQINGWNASVKADLQELTKENGVNSVKIDMTGITSTSDMIECFECCKELGVTLSIYGYNGEAVKISEKKTLEKGIQGPEGHLISRSEELEQEAVTTAVCVAQEVGVPIILNNISSGSTVDLVAENEKVFVAPAVSNIAVDGGNLFNSCWSHASSFVSDPPIRDNPESTDKFLNAILQNSTNQMVCSNHCPFSFEARAQFGKSDFSVIPKGVNGVHERFSLVWHKVVTEEKGDSENVVALTSANAAKAFNLYPKKGCVAEGSDADIVVIDPEKSISFSAKDDVDLDFNIYEGQKIFGAPTAVLLKGKVMVFENEFNCDSQEAQEQVNVLELNCFSPLLYDDKVNNDGEVPVVRSLPADLIADGDKSQSQNNIPAEFGKTTPRGGGAEQAPVLNKALGVYQRPMSAHGIRNQQDSTFSLTGGYESPSRTRVKISSPPGGGSESFW